MRKLFGGLLFFAGVCALGYWGAKSHAVDMQSAITAGAQKAVSNAVHDVTTEVNGRDIRITGLADSEDERTALISALNNVEGRRVVVDELELLPLANPFTIAATRKNGETMLQGNVPSEAVRAVFAQRAAGTDGLTIASGAPERWESAVGAGLGALSQMEEGSASITGTTLRLTGVVDFPSDKAALLDAVSLPEGYSLEDEIEARDDGLPIAYDVSYDAAGGLSVDGKLPKGLDLDQIGEALGISSISGETTAGLSGDPAAGLAVLSALKNWLPEFDSAIVKVDEGAIAISGITSPGVDAALVQESFVAELPEGVSLTAQTQTALPENGAIRVSALTGQSERFQSGSWLPIFDFAASLDACKEQADGLLARQKISFLSGSANLGPQSQRAINGLASILDRCMTDGGHGGARFT